MRELVLHQEPVSQFPGPRQHATRGNPVRGQPGEPGLHGPLRQHAAQALRQGVVRRYVARQGVVGQGAPFGVSDSGQHPGDVGLGGGGDRQPPVASLVITPDGAGAGEVGPARLRRRAARRTW